MNFDHLHVDPASGTCHLPQFDSSTLVRTPEQAQRVADINTFLVSLGLDQGDTPRPGHELAMLFETLSFSELKEAMIDEAGLPPAEAAAKMEQIKEELLFQNGGAAQQPHPLWCPVPHVSSFREEGRAMMWGLEDLGSAVPEIEEGMPAELDVRAIVEKWRLEKSEGKMEDEGEEEGENEEDEDEDEKGLEDLRHGDVIDLMEYRGTGCYVVFFHADGRIVGYKTWEEYGYTVPPMLANEAPIDYYANTPCNSLALDPRHLTVGSQWAPILAEAVEATQANPNFQVGGDHDWLGPVDPARFPQDYYGHVLGEYSILGWMAGDEVPVEPEELTLFQAWQQAWDQGVARVRQNVQQLISTCHAEVPEDVNSLIVGFCV